MNKLIFLLGLIFLFSCESPDFSNYKESKQVVTAPAEESPEPEDSPIFAPTKPDNDNVGEFKGQVSVRVEGSVNFDKKHTFSFVNGIPTESVIFNFSGDYVVIERVEYSLTFESRFKINEWVTKTTNKGVEHTITSVNEADRGIHVFEFVSDIMTDQFDDVVMKRSTKQITFSKKGRIVHRSRETTPPPEAKEIVPESYVTVRPGENVKAILRRYNNRYGLSLTLNDLRRLNPGIPNLSQVQPGVKIRFK